MNFVGKFDAKLQVDGSGAHPEARHHVDSISAHAPSDAIIVPDADLLFNGDFKRSGVDLILSRNDHEWVVEDYFKGEKRAPLASSDGAQLTGDIINALAGHVQYAQADGSAGAGKVIGHVTKLTGTATAIRNGVSIILNQGDNVEKGDVVQSGSGSTLGLTFIDGTVFGLSANARMVLNEMIYDPNGSDNSTLISLVSGTISFVAGQTAKHGDMKVDTPVATMGIRGTAVLVEINFDVPGQNGKPEAEFYVLVEPDGNVGHYILYDKNTFTPMALVDKAGQRVHISENSVSFSDSPLTPELQKLVTDVFTWKFSTNPQTFTHFADTLIPQMFPLAPLPSGAVPTATIFLVTPSTVISGTSAAAPAIGSPIPHINQKPVVTTADSSLAERAGVTGNSGIDTTSGTISFADINLGDRPTAKATISSFTYQNAQHQDIAASVQELADIHALEDIPLVVVQAPGNTYFGSATWTFNAPDKAFDFLGAGDTLTLTYMAEVDSNYAGGNLATLVPFTITITGTNDAPVITTGAENVAFVSVGTGTTGPSLPPTGPTINKLKFKDPDLTDTHTVSTHLAAATLSGNGITPLDMQALETKFPRPMGVFESALSAAVTTDSTGTGTGTITWTLADISAYYADIVPAGETLKLTYTVTVRDSQGATSTQKVVVTITGSAPPAVVWVETTKDALTDPAPGDWNGAHNWETGTVPTASDDVIIITDQLQGPTPFYPVTIKAAVDGGLAAFAHSVTMDNFDDLANTPGATAPELDIGRVLTPAEVANGVQNGSLTIGTDISLSADSILKVFGTLSVGTIAKILGNSVLDNSGVITLGQGGQFGGSSSITNSGKIEVVSDTLDVQVAVANSGGTLQIDKGATLKLSSATAASTTITGGNLTLGSGSMLDVESAGGATLDGVTVTGTNASTGPTVAASLIEIGAAGSSTLKLDDGTSIENGNLTIAAGSTLDIEKGATGPGATLDGVTVIGTDATSTIDVGTTGSGATVALLDDGTSIKNATLNIAAGSTLDIEKGATGPGATLDGVTVIGTDATSTIDVGTTGSGATVALLDDGTSIKNATLNIAAGSTLDIEKGATGPGATLDGVTVIGNGTTSTIDVGTTGSGATVALLDDGTSIKNATLNIAAGSTLDIEKGATGPGATLDGVTVIGTDATSTIDVGTTGSGATVALLDDGTSIKNATLNIAAGSTLDIEKGATGPGATLDGVTVIGNGTTSTIDVGTTASGATVALLDDGTSIKNATLNIAAGSTLDIEKGATGPGATLDGVTVIGTDATSTIDVGTTGSGATVALLDDGTSIKNATLNIAAGSTLDIEKGATGPGATLDGVTVIGTDATSTIDVGTTGSGATVALLDDGTSIKNATLNIAAMDTVEVAGAVTLLNDTVTNTGTLQVDDGITLKLDGTTINGGTINDFSSAAGGNIDVTGASKIAGTSIIDTNLNGNGTGTVQLDAALTLDYVKLNGITLENGPLTIEDTVEVAGAVTLLDDTVTNNSGIIQVDDSQTLTLSGTEIIGGIINDFSGLLGGNIDVTGDSKIDSGATLNNGAVTVESGVTLTLDNMTVNGTVFNDLVTGGTIQIDGGDTLTFNGSTIDGGTLNIVGELDSTGTSFITGATIINSSHIDVVSGILTIDPTPVTNTGMIEVKGDATLVLSDEIITNTDGTTKGVIQVDADTTHTATLDLEGSTINGGTVTIAGVLDSTGDSFITGADITNTGTIDVTGGILTIDATSILYNTGGTLETNGGNLIINAAIVGSLDIKGGGVLELGSSSANAYSQATVTFEPGATGTLKLDHSETFNGTVAGLDDNTIDLADIVYGSNPTVSYAGNASGGILSVFEGGVDVSNIKLTGDYLGVHWVLTGDGSSQHGTDVMEVPGAVAGLDHNGNATQGVALTASITDGGQTVSGATYDWQVSHDGGKTWVDANGTNGLSSYTPVEADEGQLLRVALSFVDHSGEPEKSFVSAGVVQESLTDDLVATLDSQTAKQGVTMHVTGVKDGGITVTTGLAYAWQDSSDNGLTWVTVGTHSSYTPGESDEGKLMQLVVTYADASGSESSTYSLGMPNDLSATLDSMTAQQGLAIHVTAVNDGGTAVSNGVSYAWQVSSDNGKDWTTVGTHSDYTPTAANAGDLLQVVVTYMDSHENESATYSLGSVAPAKEWLGGTHDWQASGQWATSGAPTSSDNAVIDASGFYTVKIDQAAVAHSLVVNDLGAAVEILAGNTLTLGGNATIEAGILQIDSGATLKDIAASATITGAFIDNGTVEAAGGTLEVASAISVGAGKFKIDAGATLQLDHADTLKVAFSGAGELILKDPTHFTGIISDDGGSLTSTDVVDVAGFDTGASVSYSGFKSGGIVTISETGHTAVNLIVGANSTHWSAPASDGHGGILIHDPPADTGSQALASVVIPDPAPAATSTIVASAPNQILTGNAASDTFAFNFTGVGQTTVTDFHPATDTLQFESHLFANLQAALNATHDDGHGDTVIALDAHDTITLNGILKAQLHASDFHFV